MPDDPPLGIQAGLGLAMSLGHVSISGGLHSEVVFAARFSFP